MIEYENLGRTNKSLEKEYKECFSSFLESGWYVLGKEVRTFEEVLPVIVESSIVLELLQGWMP